MTDPNAAIIIRLPAPAFLHNALSNGLMCLLTLAGTCIAIFALGENYGASKYAYYGAGSIFIGSLVGYLIGGVSINVTDDKLRDDNRSAALTALDSEHPPIIGSFISITVLLAAFYIIFYFLAVYSMSRHIDSETTSPIDTKVLILSAVTIGVFGIFSVRYANHVKMTWRLETALAAPPETRNRDLIEVLRAAVFRGEHLYEPPGNIFVTVGITATFVGLAVALVILDLPSLLGQASAGDTAEAANAVQQAAKTPAVLEEERRVRAMASLTAFVGCMGLALGMSMLGVMTAMAAQWLRGLGASRCTDDLVAEADRYLAPVAPTTTQVQPALSQTGMSAAAPVTASPAGAGAAPERPVLAPRSAVPVSAAGAPPDASDQDTRDKGI